jgi:hypothetical protein
MIFSLGLLAHEGHLRHRSTMQATADADPLLRAKLVLKRPDDEAAQRLAGSLTEVGLCVVQTTRTGVYVEGNRSTFARAFGTPVEINQAVPRFAGQPKFETLLGGEDVESIYFPTPPTRF